MSKPRSLVSRMRGSADAIRASSSEVVRLCREAGAKRILVTDASINEPRSCFERSGIAPAARAEGAEVVLPEARKFREVDLRGEVL